MKELPSLWNKWGEMDEAEKVMKNYKKGDDPLWDIFAEELQKEINSEIIKRLQNERD